jgi:hypothetical protein
MTEEDKGFVIKDRRFFSEDGTPREADEETEKTPPSEKEPPKQTEKPPQASAGQSPKAEKGARGRALPPVDFSGLILSLSHAAMLHLGQIPDMQTGHTRKDPELARHSIDTIGMLREKTKGNLTPEEQKLIDNALTELRLAFVRLAQ